MSGRINNAIIADREMLTTIIKDVVADAVDDRVPKAIREAEKGEWMDKHAVADVYGLTSRQLTYMRNNGRIDFTQHGRRILYNRESLDEWIEEGRVRVRKEQRPTVRFAVSHNNSASGSDPLPTLGGLSEYLAPDADKCVYFLLRRKQIVYVGRTNNLPARIENHRADKAFDRVMYLCVPSSELDDTETAFIRHLKPEYNSDRQCSLEVTPRLKNILSAYIIGGDGK